ncbi:MAG: magnesium/cobalt transporter CorA, partial [Thermodesulfobacteriota bacterium]
MTQYKHNPKIKVGLMPGEIVHVGERKQDNTRIRVIDFNPETLEEKELESIDQCIEYKNKNTVSWINIDGLHDAEAIARIGREFNINPLALEDIVNTQQSTKIEEFDNCIFIVTKMIYFDESTKNLVFEQISFVMGENYVITFQERVGDVFEPVRDRIRTSSGRIRNRLTDYLTYSLIDIIVDNYFIVIDRLNTLVNDMEADLMDNPSQKTLKKMYFVKRELLKLSRNIRPLREVAGYLYRDDSTLIEERNKSFLRDLYDHTIDINESIDLNREMISGMIDTYISITGNKLNEIMKVLTIIASIFIPLTFIAGIYGMNFDNMPELHTKWGYFIALSAMAVIGVGMVYY